MNWNRPAWWPLHLRGRLSREPDAALFQGLRVRLTLWYCGVLGAALVLFGVALYFGTQYYLLRPVADDAAAHARVHVGEWFAGAVDRACPLMGLGQFGQPSGQGFQMPELAVCYDQNGNLPPGENTTGLSSAFLANNLVKSVLQSGQSASDMVNAGGTEIYRYALVVPNPTGCGNGGVVLIGESIQGQEDALALLVTGLASIGEVA